MNKSDVHNTLPCPECSRDTLKLVTGNCQLENGSVIPELEYWKCDYCGFKLFNVDAVGKVIKHRKRGRLERIG